MRLLHVLYGSVHEQRGPGGGERGGGGEKGERGLVCSCQLRTRQHPAAAAACLLLSGNKRNMARLLLSQGPLARLNQ